MIENHNVYNIFQGEKIRLRARCIEDLEYEQQESERNKRLRHHDTEVSRNYWNIPLPSPIDLHRIAEEEDIKNRNTVERCRFVIESIDGNVAVGGISTKDADRTNGRFTYSLGIAREHWRKGYASEAIKIALNFYFNELRFHKCNAAAFEFNKGSVELHRALGFVEEGRYRDYIFTNGKYYDMILFGIKDSEFNNLYRNYFSRNL